MDENKLEYFIEYQCHLERLCMSQQIELQLGEVFEIKVGGHITTWKMVTQFKAIRQSHIDWERIESEVEKSCLGKQ